MKVIIVGGSVAGLTLAHALEHIGIDFIVLEKNDDIAPQVGASIGIMPNGGQILDQLGLYDHVEKEIAPLTIARITPYDGAPEMRIAYPELLAKRFNYPIAFLERQTFLQIIYNRLPHKEKVHTSKRVLRIEKTASNYRVHVQDGTVYDGDLVVGSDGVHSTVRKLMWELANSAVPNTITTKEKTGMKSEYLCVFGISNRIPHFTPGEQLGAFRDGISVMTCHGSRGRVYWFFFKKLDRVYTYPQAPRFTKADAEKLCPQYSDIKIVGDLTFGDVWGGREVFNMLSLEENVFETWVHDRIVCIGDSMHKMTPNLGQGANTAIENAGALANLLYGLQKEGKPHTEKMEDLKERLKTFETLRKKKAKSTYSMAHMATRLHARDGLFFQLMTRYFFTSSIPSVIGNSAMGQGVTLDFLPLPARGASGRAGSSIGFAIRTIAKDISFVWILKLILMIIILFVALEFLGRMDTSLYSTLAPVMAPLVAIHKEL